VKTLIKITACGLIAALMITTVVHGSIGHRVINAVYSNIKIIFNGEEVEMTDANNDPAHAFIADRIIYVPIDLFAAAVGAEVEWDEPTATLVIEMPLREPSEPEDEGEEDVYEDVIQMYVPLHSMDYLAQGGSRNWRPESVMTLNTGTAALGFLGSRLWNKAHESSIDFYLNGEFERLTGSAALTFDTRSSVSRAVVRIYGDGDLLFESGEITAGYLPKDFDIYVGNVTVLRVDVEHLNGTDWIHAGLAGAALHRKDLRNGYN
jgi:hypothetical protein